jgi:hypothetical protein
MKVNITKEYIIDKSFEETFSKLDAIVSTKFNSAQYSTFGNIVSVDPPEFLFMAKWATIGRPFYAEFTSTRIYARVLKMENTSKIAIRAKSNPGIIVLFIFSIAVTLIKLFTYKTKEDMNLSGIYILVAIGVFLLDRFIKNIVISSFETDMKLKE